MLNFHTYSSLGGAALKLSLAEKRFFYSHSTRHDATNPSVSSRTNLKIRELNSRPSYLYLQYQYRYIPMVPLHRYYRDICIIA
jgi:hypothetical protein